MHTTHSPENFAQSQATQLAWYKNKAATLFNGMVPGESASLDSKAFGIYTHTVVLLVVCL